MGMPARGKAAFSIAIRLASASIIRCRSADLVGVLTNIRLPEHSTMRRAPAMPLFRTQSAAVLTSHAPHDSKARLRVVANCRGSWRSHVHRTLCHIRKAAELPTAVQCAVRAALRAPIRQCRGSRGTPLVFLWGFQRGHSLWKENPPFAPRPHGSGTEHRALWASKKRIQLSLYE